MEELQQKQMKAVLNTLTKLIKKRTHVEAPAAPKKRKTSLASELPADFSPHADAGNLKMAFLIFRKVGGNVDEKMRHRLTNIQGTLTKICQNRVQILEADAYQGPELTNLDLVNKAIELLEPLATSDMLTSDKEKNQMKQVLGSTKGLYKQIVKGLPAVPLATS